MLEFNYYYSSFPAISPMDKQMFLKAVFCNLNPEAFWVGKILSSPVSIGISSCKMKSERLIYPLLGTSLPPQHNVRCASRNWDCTGLNGWQSLPERVQKWKDKKSVRMKIRDKEQWNHSAAIHFEFVRHSMFAKNIAERYP